MLRRGQAGAPPPRHARPSRPGRAVGALLAVVLMTTILSSCRLTSIGQISAGVGHACSVDDAGAVTCWGRNSRGQLGDGTTVSSPDPVQVSGLSAVTAVSAGTSTGDSHTCALLGDETVECWGPNTDGQLGDSTTADRSTPTPVTGLVGVTQISAGGSHTCALLQDQTVSCWGRNHLGQLGDGTQVPRSTPTAVPGLADVTQIAAGAEYTCALLADTTATCWGNNSMGQLGTGTSGFALTPVAVTGLAGATQLTVAYDHTCALLVGGSAMCWGGNSAGQVGNGTTAAFQLTAVAVVGLTDAVQIDAGTTPGFGVGTDHTCALMNDETVTCWGANRYGQLGDGTTTDQSSPVTVAGVTGAQQVSAGGAATCAVLADEVARCWGLNTWGQLGTGAESDRSVLLEPPYVGSPGPLTTVAQIDTGAGGGCARLDDGSARCWGEGFWGELGNGDRVDFSAPLAVLGVDTAIDVSRGANHGCALLADGTVECWGSNDNYRLGSTVLGPHPTPIAVPGLANVTMLAAGANHTCALRADGLVGCWGQNFYGQLGRGATGPDRATPARVTGLAGVVQISSGALHTCAVLDTGSIKCWGHNDNGSLGDGFVNDSPTPVAVAGITNAVEVSAGSAHTCARLADGTAMCWGSNTSGQLGMNSLSAASWTPVAVWQLTDVVDITAGGGHSCAVLGDGTARCWGGNAGGALGDGTTIGPRTAPVAVVGLTGAEEISAGTGHTCARSGDTLSCWGTSNDGALGNGALNATMTTPTPVLAGPTK